MHLRTALIAGDAVSAAVWLPDLDADHLVEVVLGAALRDARARFAAAHRFLDLASLPLDAPEWRPLLEMLATPGDTGPDDVAAAYVASRHVPDVLRPGGRALTGAELEALRDEPESTLVGLIAAGVSLEALLPAFHHHSLHRAVEAYYAGGIRAMAWRPLLLLGIVPSPQSPIVNT